MREYNIGLDIGTNSLGWAVADLNGELCTFKDKSMIGTVLIPEAGKTAAERRGYRSARRRLVRRRQRIAWLQELMAPLLEKEDPDFFRKLKYSYVSKKDDSINIDPSILFDNSHYKTTEFNEKFPTIYHLRKYLTIADEVVDIRLIYLAIHHIIKYRGNFLYEGQDISVKNLNLAQSLQEMIETIADPVPIDERDSFSAKIAKTADEIKAEIDDTSVIKKDKAKHIANFIQPYAPKEIESPKVWATAIAQLIIGSKANVSSLFDIKIDKNVSFSDDAIAQVEEQLNGKKFDQFRAIQKVYLGQLLASISSGNVSTISDVYIATYDAHHKDLETLKRVLKKCPNPKVYENLINNKANKAKSYAKYIASSPVEEDRCSNKQLCNAISNAINDESNKIPQDDADVKYCLSRIEEEQFLLKPRNSNNGVIPYQLHCEELALIIDKQSKFYPELAEIKGKILSIASFRIPYFVGPLSTNDERHWVVRSNDKIYPWNFSDVVDKNTTAEEFIKRLTNKCTFLIHEDVLPKNSLLFSKYSVLNELSNVYVNGRRLSAECKIAAVEELFKENRSVTIAKFRNWYKKKYLPPRTKENPEIEGLSDKKKFISNLASHIDMENILGPLDSEEKLNKAEKIIEIITIFTDKEIKETKLREAMPDGLSEEKIKALLQLPYKGWGRLSKKFLTGLHSKDGSSVTIMNLLQTTEKNLMEIVYSKYYKFEEVIFEENQKYISSGSSGAKDIIMSYPGSPAIKKVSLVAIKVIKEIIKVKGREPKSIFIEMARGDEEKKQTESRYTKIEKLYANIEEKIENELEKTNKEDEKSEILKLKNDIQKVHDELKKNYKNDPKGLNKKSIYLYFLQCGRCLYTGKQIDLSELKNGRVGQVDHIRPRSYRPNSSIDNLALVMTKENQRKANSKVLEDSIIKKQEPRWNILLKNELMTKKKFDALCAKEINENLVDKFINRQLVETRQICKNVLNSVKAIYENVSVYGVSAQLTDNIKRRIGVLKIRELNDYHHAIDAYTTLMAGDFSQYVLSTDKIKNLRNMISEDKTGTKEEIRYGVVAELFYKTYPGWLILIEECAKSHDFFVNCLVEEKTGRFYKQTLQRKSSNNLIPKKAKMKTELYGGYSGKDDAYYCVVKDKETKECAVVGIPIQVASLQKQDPSAKLDYLKNLKDPKNPKVFIFKDPEIKKDKIKKYQHIYYSENGVTNEYYMTGASEQMNAKQLWITETSMQTLARLLNGLDITDEKEITELYDELCDKIVKFYPTFKSIGENCMNYKTQFMKLPKEGKIKHIQNMLTVVHASGTSVRTWNYKDVDGNDVEFKIGSSRRSIQLKPENITFIDSSITGMFTRKYTLDL